MAVYGPETFRDKSGSEVVFRHLRAEDANELAVFRLAIARDTTHTLQYEGQKTLEPEIVVSRLAESAADPVQLNLGAFDGASAQGRMVGYLNFRPIIAGHPWLRHSAQFGMMVLRSHWGHGIGRRLLEIQDEHAGRVGVSRIEAMVRAENTRGLRLYQNAGFAIEGIRRHAVVIDGKPADEYFIAKLTNRGDAVQSAGQSTGHAAYAVIFTSRRTATGPAAQDREYEAVSARMSELASRQPGFRGIQSVRDSAGTGITVSYWDSLEAIRAWKADAEHQAAQKSGKERWYSSYEIQICRVERQYGRN